MTSDGLNSQGLVLSQNRFWNTTAVPVTARGSLAEEPAARVCSSQCRHSNRSSAAVRASLATAGAACAASSSSRCAAVRLPVLVAIGVELAPAEGGGIGVVDGSLWAAAAIAEGVPADLIRLLEFWAPAWPSKTETPTCGGKKSERALYQSASEDSMQQVCSCRLKSKGANTKHSRQSEPFGIASLCRMKPCEHRLHWYINIKKASSCQDIPQ